MKIPEPSCFVKTAFSAVYQPGLYLSPTIWVGTSFTLKTARVFDWSGHGQPSPRFPAFSTEPQDFTFATAASRAAALRASE